jgi:hypothetical protein
MTNRLKQLQEHFASSCRSALARVEEEREESLKYLSVYNELADLRRKILQAESSEQLEQLRLELLEDAHHRAGQEISTSIAYLDPDNQQ